MDEKFEQCSDGNVSESASSEMSTCNQEVPQDLKAKQEEHSEARKAGRTPSSLDLPKISVEDFFKYESVVCNESGLPQDTCTGPDAPICSDEGAVPSEKTRFDAVLPSSTETDDDGRVVRERYAAGADIVIAYDDAGQPHRFQNEPIKQIPPDFSVVPEFRQKQLERGAEDLIAKYTSPDNNGEYGRLDFQKIADMQKEIAQREDLTETEKCLLYTKAQEIMHDRPIPIENWNEKPEMIDSWSGASDPWHAVAPLDDRYHNRLVNLSPEESSKAIQEQEDRTEGDMHDSWYKRVAWKVAREVFDINQGDINASEGQVKAMREMKEKGTFGAYAEEWERQYVDKDGVNPRGGTGHF